MTIDDGDYILSLDTRFDGPSCLDALAVVVMAAAKRGKAKQGKARRKGEAERRGGSGRNGAAAVID